MVPEETGVGVEAVLFIAMVLVETVGDVQFAEGEAGTDKERVATAGDSARWVGIVGDAGELDEGESISRVAEGGLDGAAATVIVVVGGDGERLVTRGGGVSSSAAIVTTFWKDGGTSCARQRLQMGAGGATGGMDGDSFAFAFLLLFTCALHLRLQ